MQRALVAVVSSDPAWVYCKSARAEVEVAVRVQFMRPTTSRRRSSLSFCTIHKLRYSGVQFCYAMVGPLRNPLRSPAVRTFSTASPLRAAGSTASGIPVPPPLSKLETQQHMQQAREWIARFEKVRTDAWPKSTYCAPFSPTSLCAITES